MHQDLLDKPFLPLDRVRILRYFSFFSILVSLAVLGVYFNELEVASLGQFDQRLFPVVVSLYFALGVVFTLIAFNTGQAEYDHLIVFFLLDITAIGAMVYCSGPNDALAYLMIMSVAVGNSLVSGQKGYLLAAWATICLIYVHHLHKQTGATVDMVAVGSLGVIFFTSAAVIQALVKRLHLSIDITKQQAENILTMEQLTRLVLKRLQTGIIVIDDSNEVIFQNQAAQKLLGYPAALRGIPAQLAKRLNTWKKFPKAKLEPFKAGPTTAKVQAMFAELMPGTNRGIVIFLEDTNVVLQQAQRLKQASLGKLAASIAREIKEPLKRIHGKVKEISRHSIFKQDGDLAKDIQNNAIQVNRIVENVMDLSKSKAPELKRIVVNEWMKNLITELNASTLGRVQLEVKMAKATLEGYFDPIQLRQTTVNILENAVHFATQKSPQDAKVTIAVGRNKVSGQTIIEITDNGYGVTADSLDHLYEPFFTSEEGKSGLGLYLAKEFCEMNLSRLDYVPTQEGAKFRITFATKAAVEKKIKTDQPFLIRDKVKKVVGF